MVLKRVSGLEERVASLDKRVDMVLRFMLVLNAPLLTAVIGILLKIVNSVNTIAQYRKHFETQLAVPILS